MSLVHKKGEKVRLRDVGLNESWLQDRIDEDPAILGLGELKVIEKEKSQSSGGRLDCSSSLRALSQDHLRCQKAFGAMGSCLNSRRV